MNVYNHSTIEDNFKLLDNLVKFKDNFGIIGDMLGEAERVRFRQGENANRPIGGHVANAPFAFIIDRRKYATIEAGNHKDKIK